MERPLYTIKAWERHYENAQSRKSKKSHRWVAMPNKHDGKGFRRIMAMRDGAAIYGAWCLIVQIASKCPMRGVLADDDGPLDAEDMASKTGCPSSVFSRALEVLTSERVAWILVEVYQSATRPVEQSGSGLEKSDATLPYLTVPYLTDKYLCSETPSASAEPTLPVLEFPCDGPVPTWGLTPSQADDWSRLFPSLDILAECRSAKAWLLANTSKRKTAKGMPRFLVNWFTRSQERPRSSTGPPSARSHDHLDPTEDDIKKIGAK